MRTLPIETVYERLRERMSMMDVDTLTISEHAQRALTLALVCARERRFEEAEQHADFGRAAVAWLRTNRV